MGTFHVKFKVSVLTNKEVKHISFLVDTGSTFSVMPSDMLDQLGVKPEYADLFELADGRKIKRRVGFLFLYYRKKKIITPVVFGRPRTEPLLGAVALEGLGLMADPVQRRLRPTRLLMKYFIGLCI